MTCPVQLILCNVTFVGPTNNPKDIFVIQGTVLGLWYVWVMYLTDIVERPLTAVSRPASHVLEGHALSGQTLQNKYPLLSYVVVIYLL